MRESRTYGSVRGALSNGCPYRVWLFCCGAYVRFWHEADILTCPYLSAFGGKTDMSQRMSNDRDL